MGSRTTLICTNCHERRFPQSFPANSVGQRPPRWAVCFPCRKGVRDQLLWLRKHMRTWSEVGRFVGIYDAHRLRYVAMLQWPRLDIREAITGAVDRVKGRIAEAKGNHAPRLSCGRCASPMESYENLWCTGCIAAVGRNSCPEARHVGVR